MSQWLVARKGYQAVPKGAVGSYGWPFLFRNFAQNHCDTMKKLQLQSVAKATNYRFDIEKAKGRPMLQWVGKRPLDKIEYYPAQEKEIYGDKS